MPSREATCPNDGCYISSNAHNRLISSRSSSVIIFLFVVCSNCRMVVRISALAANVNGPMPIDPLRRLGHRLNGSFLMLMSQFRKSRNGCKCVYPAFISSIADLSFLTTVHDQQPKRPDAQGGDWGERTIGHSPVAPRYMASNLFTSMVFGVGRIYIASQTVGTSHLKIGRKIRYFLPASTCTCQ